MVSVESRMTAAEWQLATAGYAAGVLTPRTQSPPGMTNTHGRVPPCALCALWVKPGLELTEGPPGSISRRMPSNPPFPVVTEERSLAAIVFTDAVGFSARVEASE